jgi:hypothetical protein
MRLPDAYPEGALEPPSYMPHLLEPAYLEEISPGPDIALAFVG